MANFPKVIFILTGLFIEDLFLKTKYNKIRPTFSTFLNLNVRKLQG